MKNGAAIENEFALPFVLSVPTCRPDQSDGPSEWFHPGRDTSRL